LIKVDNIFKPKPREIKLNASSAKKFQMNSLTYSYWIMSCKHWDYFYRFSQKRLFGLTWFMIWTAI